ncbi:hypothetical protein [Pedobacter heparinus]|uniref:hypothetical protein n=1 Tax=Pedobacter heparinus TaxID=984 RepID=UPI002930906F|nr:hypothetical protein [Pedobacter heparinus]
MKKRILLFILITGIFSNTRILAQQTANVSVGGSGWKRIASIQGDNGRGFGRISLYTIGGTYTPNMTSVNWHHDWGSNAGLSIYSDSDESPYWSGFRITDDGLNAYIEVNFTAAVTTLTLLLDDYGWRAATLYTGTLPDGGGDVRSIASNGRISVENEFILKHNGFVGIGTSDPQAKLHVNGHVKLSGNYDGTNNVQFATAGGAGSTWELYPQPNGFGIFNRTNNSWPIFITNDNNIGIGNYIPVSGYKLAVNGKIRAQEIKVEASPWPDYVFSKDYQLLTLQQTEQHIKEKGHLPDIPSAAEVKVNGIDVGEMNAKLLQKIEELTLYLIKKDKELSEERSINKNQEQRLKKLEFEITKNK